MATATLMQDRSIAAKQFLSESSGTLEVLPSPYDVESEATCTIMGAEEATALCSRPRKEISPYVPEVARASTPRRFDPLQQWEGVVEAIDGGVVTATIADLTDSSRELEIVTFPQQEFSEADWPVLVPNSVFYWSIGYEYVTGGTKRRVSEFRVRRTPEWSELLIESVKKSGLELYRRYGGCAQDDSTREE